MTINASIKIEGLKELNNLLKKLPDRVENKVVQAATTSAIRKSVKHIKSAAPYSGDGKRSAKSIQYGHLRDNIAPGKSKTRRGWKSSFVTVRKSFWGYFLEYGTRSIAARPWFVPAFERAGNEMISHLKTRLQIGIDREFNKLK